MGWCRQKQLGAPAQRRLLLLPVRKGWSVWSQSWVLLCSPLECLCSFKNTTLQWLWGEASRRPLPACALVSWGGCPIAARPGMAPARPLYRRAEGPAPGMPTEALRVFAHIPCDTHSCSDAVCSALFQRPCVHTQVRASREAAGARTFPRLRAPLEGSGSYRQSNSRISLTFFYGPCLHKT